VDGEALKANPVVVMNALQKELNITPFFDYANHLTFDEKKGFFCQSTGGGKTKCLGKSKGRKYPPMDDKSAAFVKVRGC
jgi:heparan sulfate N-deacetylase/N-sulfotransferase NDST2